MILRLTLNKKWFDMILSGEKKEEYREIKMYWATRFCNGFPTIFGLEINNPDFKSFDHIVFTNGYSSASPMMNVELRKIEVGIGYEPWGAPNRKVYILHLGKIISTKNIK